MKKLFILAVVAFVGMTASAQLISSNTITRQETNSNNYSRYAVGYNSVSFSDDIDESLTGFSLEWNKGISVSTTLPLFVETGIGASYSWTSKDDVDYRFATIQVPLNLVYKYEVTDGVKIAPYAGLYFRGNLFAEIEEDGDTNNLFDDMEDGGWEAKRFSYGFQIGVGVEFNKLYLGINYGTDLNKFIDIDETVYDGYYGYDYKVSSKTSTFTAKVGFNF